MTFSEQLGSRLAELKLPSETLLVLSEGNPSASLPYHNNEHNYCVAVNAYDLGAEANLSYWELKHLIVSGMFHDYGHTGTSGPDYVNIIAANQAITTYSKTFEKLNLSPQYLRKLISATINPNPGYNTPSERIMRDADLMGWTYGPDYNKKQMEGLSLETGNPVSYESSKKFFQSVSFYQPTAKHRMIAAGWL